MKTQKKLTRFLTFAFLGPILLAFSEGEQKQSSSTVVKSDTQIAISKLDFLVGNWAGLGISYSADGTQTSYHDTEHVRFDLDKNLLLINARGEKPDGEMIYSLHTVIFYNSQSQKYIYTPFTGKNKVITFECTLNDLPQLICLTQNQDYRLTFQRLDDGGWNEYGEVLKDGEWVKNAETILSAA